jgi:hypothetical protein
VNASSAARYQSRGEAADEKDKYIVRPIRIVGVLLASDLIARGKVTNRRDKYRKENGYKYRSLWNTEHTVRNGRRHAAKMNSLMRAT